MPPAPTTTTTNGAKPDYLRDQPPASAALQGLSIFAAVVVLRLCIRRYQRWRSRRLAPSQLNEQNTLYWQDANANTPPPPYTQQPYRWTMSEKNEGIGYLGGSNDNKNDTNNMSLQDEHAGDDRRHKTGADGLLRNLIARPPPAPPLTPPELSSTVFTLEGRPGVQDSFFDQPNPDYTSPSTGSSSSRPTSSTTTTATSHPRRLSYQKTIPIGVPVSRHSSASESDLYFSPSSFPSASPLLPPAPPRVMSEPSHDERSPDRREINVHGEIIGVLDSNGHGWSRHTRVYGGGVCLACTSAGRQHGEGGFYGPNVLPEEMR